VDLTTDGGGMKNYVDPTTTQESEDPAQDRGDNLASGGATADGHPGTAQYGEAKDNHAQMSDARTQGVSQQRVKTECY
jgi:hypothetical protein